MSFYVMPYNNPINLFLRLQKYLWGFHTPKIVPISSFMFLKFSTFLKFSMILSMCTSTYKVSSPWFKLSKILWRLHHIICLYHINCTMFLICSTSSNSGQPFSFPLTFSGWVIFSVLRHTRMDICQLLFTLFTFLIAKLLLHQL